jgi:cytoskeletal protein RodZ
MAWRFAHDAVVRREGQLQNIITLSALLVAVVACGIWLWAAYQRTPQETLQTQLQKEHNAALAIIVRATTPLPYPPALDHLNKAVSQTIKRGGSLVQFEHKNGRSNWSLNIDNSIVTETAGAGARP